MEQQALAQAIANQILDGFHLFISNFRKITQRAKQRFETHDWHGIQSDSQERLLLYKNSVLTLAKDVRSTMGPLAVDFQVWQAVKSHFAELLKNSEGHEVIETFYNSVCRKVFTNIGGEPLIMFLTTSSQAPVETKRQLFDVYEGDIHIKDVIKEALIRCNFNVPFINIDQDVNNIVERIVDKLIYEDQYKPEDFKRIEVLKSIFYRNKAAYIVGRVVLKQHDNRYIPFILPLLHNEEGIYVDTLILNPNDVSIIFSFTRSYFLVDVEVPSELISFLKTLIPDKSTSELYNSIGFSKHGKTELYRDFLQHLEQSDDQFIIAPGIKGMVMSVFLLPSYNIVFKLIKDKFDPPKKGTQQIVKEKYRLVKVHDRAGRMADTHEFEHFAFVKSRFSDELLEELQKVAPSLVEIDEENDRVIIRHLYTERRMIPLNIYLDEATDDEKAREAVDEYGNAIKQLAAANIFPGDMLLKNFGVTRHRRVVFYDYDEIVFLTECNFRRIPEPRDYYEEYASEAWYAVGENDIFPEEFRKFLIGHNHIRKMFYELHGDIFDVKFWKEMQKRINNGEIVDIFPYRRRKRFINQNKESEE